MKSKYRTFGVTAILAITAVVAAMLVGYKSGFKNGIIDRDAATVSTRSYYVAPLVIADKSAPSQTPDYSPLITLIRSTVSSDSWGNRGGSIEVDQQNHSLLVSQTVHAHRELDCFFKMLVRLDRLRMQKDVKSVDMQLKTARDDAEELAIAANSAHIERVLAELIKKIENGMLQLPELALDLARSEAALKSGREACEEYIWLHESGGGFRPGSMETAGNPEETTAEGNKIAGITPKEYMQRHIIKVKQQIGDLRSVLSSDLAIYRSNYKKAVKFEAAMATVQKLQIQKEKFVGALDYCDRAIGPFVGEGRPFHGTIK